MSKNLIPKIAKLLGVVTGEKFMIRQNKYIFEDSTFMFDKTNVHNSFQGTLRYGFLEDADQAARIAKDWAIVGDNANFKKSMAVTHCNEFDCETEEKYFSDDPYEVKERK